MSSNNGASPRVVDTSMLVILRSCFRHSRNLFYLGLSHAVCSSRNPLFMFQNVQSCPLHNPMPYNPRNGAIQGIRNSHSLSLSLSLSLLFISAFLSQCSSVHSSPFFLRMTPALIILNPISTSTIRPAYLLQITSKLSRKVTTIRPAEQGSVNKTTCQILPVTHSWYVSV